MGGAARKLFEVVSFLSPGAFEARLREKLAGVYRWPSPLPLAFFEHLFNEMLRLL